MRTSLADSLRHAAIVLKRVFLTRGVRGPTLTLLSGSTLAAAFSFLMQPVLTRLYSPEEFGVLGYFMALMSLLVTVSSFQYENALMQPDTEEEAINIMWLSALLLGITTLLLSIVVPWRMEIARVLRMPEAGPYLILLPPALLGFRAIKLAELWFARAKKFHVLTGGQFVNGVTTTSFRTVAALFPISAGAGGLVGGIMAGQIAASAIYIPLLARRHGRRFIRTFDLRRIIRLARRYRRFSLFSTPANTLNTLLGRLPFLLIPLFFAGSSNSILGYFGQAVNVLAVPLGFIGSAVAQVLFVHAAEAARSGQLHHVAERVHARLVAIGLFPTLLLITAGPDLLGFMLGTEWREAGVFARVLSPWVFLSAVAAPLTRIFDVLERQRLDFMTSLSMFTALAVGLLAGGLTRNVTIMLVLVGLAGTLGRTVQIAVMLRLAGVRPREAFYPYIRGMLISLPILFPIGIASFLGSIELIIVVATGGLIAYGLYVFKPNGDRFRRKSSQKEEAELPSGSPASS